MRMTKQSHASTLMAAGGNRAPAAANRRPRADSGKRYNFRAWPLAMQRQELGAMPTPFAHEQSQAVLRRRNEPVRAAEFLRRVDDHRWLPNLRVAATGLSNFVIAVAM